MVVITPVLAGAFLLGLGGGIVVWIIFQRRRTSSNKKPARETVAEKAIRFRWIYVILPITFLLLSIIMAAYLYHLLPGEIAYNFKSGSPDKWLIRGAIMAWMLTPQFLFTLLAVVIVWGVIKLSSRFRLPDSTVIKKVLLLMGNMVALPQIILSFAMLDIFSYNAYQTHIMPLWVFTLIVMGGGGVVLGIFFILAIRRSLATARKSFKERE